VTVWLVAQCIDDGVRFVFQYSVVHVSVECITVATVYTQLGPTSAWLLTLTLALTLVLILTLTLTLPKLNLGNELTLKWTNCHR